MKIYALAFILSALLLAGAWVVHEIRLADKAKEYEQIIDDKDRDNANLLAASKEQVRHHEQRANTLEAQLNALMSVDDDCATHVLQWSQNEQASQ